MSAVILITLIISLFGSEVMPQGKLSTPTIKEATKELDTRAIRTRTNEVYTRMVGNIEELADDIFMNSDDLILANNALLWKVNAVNSGQHAFFDNDPIIALLDAYAFSAQQKHFFTIGAGKALFGDRQVDVVDLATELHSDLRSMIEKICGDHQYECVILGSIDEWVGVDPITSLYFNRNSIIEDLADAVEPFNKGIGKNVIELNESVQDMSSRMNIYSQMLPKQMRWEMQLVLVQLEMKELIDSSMSTMTQLNSVSGSMPEKMDSLLAVSMEELYAITGIATRSIGNERLEMQDWGSALTDSLTRVLLEESMRWENVVDRQRELAMLGANDMMLSSTDPVKLMIDHAFWRGIQLLLVAVVLALLALWANRKLK